MRSGVATYPVTALNGDVLTLHTANGVLHYAVRDAYGVAKEQAGFVHSLMDQNTRHRVVLITCAERHGVDYDYNIIVEAYLTSSISKTSST
jgi:sortase (surface protein transpeptidase)